MVTDTVIKKGYKQTELGAIPEDWDVKKIGEICGKVTTGKLNANAMSENGEYPFFTCAEGHYWIDKYAFDNEALLVSGNGANVGYIHHYKGKFNAYQRTYVLTEFTDEIIFIKLYMDRNLQERIRTEVNAGNTPYIKMGTLTEMNIAVPKNREEQIAIAFVLLEMSALISSLEKLIAKKRAIKQGEMQELLTGKRRLPGFSGKWGMRRLGEVVEFMRGRALSKSDISDNGSFKCIHYGQLFTEYKELIREVKSRTNKTDGYFYSKENDVLVPTSDVTPRGLATASCIREKGVILGGGILIIRFNSGYDGLFFSYFVSQNKVAILKLVKGSTVFHIYANDLATLEINFPDFSEQIAIANVLNDMDIELEVLEQRLAKYKMLKQGMMQVLLTGKVRLA